MDYEYEELDKDVDSIISQIKNQGKSIKQATAQKPELQKEDLEKFIIDNAAAVVADSIDMIQSLKTDVMASSDAKMVEATAELVKAITGAIDSLSKLKLSDDKIKGQKELKQMEIDSKQLLENDTQKEGLYISRQELINNIFKKPEPISNTPPPNTIDV